MDDWVQYSYAAIAEAWQELIRDVLAGRAVRLTINAKANAPIKIESSAFYVDTSWPGDSNQQTRNPAD